MYVFQIGYPESSLIESLEPSTHCLNYWQLQQIDDLKVMLCCTDLCAYTHMYIFPVVDERERRREGGRGRERGGEGGREGGRERERDWERGREREGEREKGKEGGRGRGIGDSTIVSLTSEDVSERD